MADIIPGFRKCNGDPGFKRDIHQEKLTAGQKKVTVRWKKQRKNTDGYEIQYSTNKKFKKAVKTVTVKNNKKNIKTIKKLKRGKEIFTVCIRTYKDVFSSGQTIRVYSDWSKEEECEGEII